MFFFYKLDNGIVLNIFLEEYSNPYLILKHLPNDITSPLPPKVWYSLAVPVPLSSLQNSLFSAINLFYLSIDWLNFVFLLSSCFHIFIHYKYCYVHACVWYALSFFQILCRNGITWSHDDCIYTLVGNANLQNCYVFHAYYLYTKEMNIFSQYI